jgi:putative Holliday junction resolvase
LILLGIDYGLARTGVAVSDPMGILASPVTVLHEASRKKLAAALAGIAEERRAEKIILGLPLRTDGAKGDKALACEALAALLGARTGLPVELWDERFSSVQAHRALGAANVRGQRRKNTVDAVAAVIILQSYLDRA